MIAEITVKPAGKVMVTLPSGETMLDRESGLRFIADQLQMWIDFSKGRMIRPTHGLTKEQLENWIAVLRAE